MLLHRLTQARIGGKGRTYTQRRIVTMAGAHISTNVAGFEAAKATLLTKPAPHFIVFTADNDPATGESWCPDCRRGVPPIISAVSKLNGSLLEVGVGARPEWKTPDHPYRHAPLKLTGVPTFMLLATDGSEVARLNPELEACNTADEVDKVLAGFFAAHHK